MLAATAFIAIGSPLAGAQAENGYDYVIWPYFPAAPAQVQMPVPSARTVLPVAAPRHSQTAFIHETTDVGFAPSLDLGRRVYVSPQMLGVGY
jgi:hypothetical protein